MPKDLHTFGQPNGPMEDYFLLHYNACFIQEKSFKNLLPNSPFQSQISTFLFFPLSLITWSIPFFFLHQGLTKCIPSETLFFLFCTVNENKDRLRWRNLSTFSSFFLLKDLVPFCFYSFFSGKESKDQFQMKKKTSFSCCSPRAERRQTHIWLFT